MTIASKRKDLHTHNNMSHQRIHKNIHKTSTILQLKNEREIARNTHLGLSERCRVVVGSGLGLARGLSAAADLGRGGSRGLLVAVRVCWGCRVTVAAAGVAADLLGNSASLLVVLPSHRGGDPGSSRC